MLAGYMGKMLWADLSRGTLEDEPLNEELCRNFLGGYGLGAKITFDRQKPGVDPLGPENTLGIVTGPFTGTPAVVGSRYTVVGKSPLTHGWGDANSGGSFAPYLKFAGYDAVFFTGISDKPVYLFIDNGKAELRDAGHIWGKDSFETEDALKAELGNDVELICIGPAGENVSLISAVMNNKGRAAARSGLGAVMGSKKLKAVAVKGNLEVPLADAAKTKELRKKNLRELTGHVDMLRQYGTPAILTFCSASGDTPTKNWSGTSVIDFPEYEALGGEKVVEQQEKRYACYQCPIGCGGHMKEGTGKYKYEAGAHKPEYETLAMFGNDCLNSDLESIIKVNDICNRYGLDTISTGSTIAMTIECFERGLITKADTDGLEMIWGNHEAIVAMTEKLAKREGFGAVIADGTKVAAERIGKGADEYAMNVQGQEAAAHDPRCNLQWAISYRLDPTPARHTQGGEGHPPGVMPEYDKEPAHNRGYPHKIGSDFTHVMGSAGQCFFVHLALPHVDSFIDTLNAITGWGVTLDELLVTGERIANIRHAFNIREGLNPLQFKVPGRMVGKPPQAEGPLAGVTVDEETLNRDYLTAMDWDLETTKPSERKLSELGLEGVAEQLYT
ncbi:MAG: aldehyde ferredoxin oxidoreductase family protein [Dehalococcoidia bacterium]